MIIKWKDNDNKMVEVMINCFNGCFVLNKYLYCFLKNDWESFWVCDFWNFVNNSSGGGVVIVFNLLC